MVNFKILISLISIFFGLIFGSFINVIAYRLPINKSIIKPRSYCPKCEKKIVWFENIPILSWLLLKGKCSNCKNSISIQYPLTEGLSAIFFFLSLNAIPLNTNFETFYFTLIASWSFVLILLPISIIDYYFLWIPNSIINIGILLGLSISIFSAVLKSQSIFSNIFESLISGLLGFLIIFLILKVGSLIYKKPVMGLGDAKLAGLIGIWLGFKGVLISIWLSFLIAGITVIIGLASKTFSRSQLIPFGPFLSLSGFLVWIYGEDLFLRNILN